MHSDGCLWFSDMAVLVGNGRKAGKKTRIDTPPFPSICVRAQ